MPRYPYGVCVRSKLRRLHKTQQELARTLGYSSSYISMILSGRYPAPAVREKIQAQLDLWEQER